LAELEDRMGNLIQSFFADPFQAGTAVPAIPVWVPPVDIEETEDSYVLEMDLPGVKPEDVNLELRDSNELRITGQYRERERTGTMRRQSRRGGEFEYDVILPGDVNAEQVDATMEDGVLLVRLAKAQPQPRRIEVRGAGGAGQVGRDTATGTSTASAAATGGAPVAGSMAEATTGGVSSAEAPPGTTRRDASSVGDRQGSAQGPPKGSPATGGPESQTRVSPGDR
jgi:HSP20 family protein